MKQYNYPCIDEKVAEAIDITKVSETTADVTHISIIYFGSGGYEATIDELIEFAEDEEDIREGLKALADGDGTITWEQYQQKRDKLNELPT